jgi:hypothetical protein
MRTSAAPPPAPSLLQPLLPAWPAAGAALLPLAAAGLRPRLCLTRGAPTSSLSLLLLLPLLLLLLSWSRG